MDVLTKSLAEYSPTVNSYADKIGQGILPVASVLILTFFLFDVLSWNRRLGQEGGQLTVQLWIEISLGYVIAFILVQNVSEIFDFIVYIFNRSIALADKILPNPTINTEIDTSGISGWMMKQVLKLIGELTISVGDILAQILVFLRFFQMYILKAVSPLIVAFFISEQTRPIAINFIKLFASYALQGLLLIIIVKLYPALVSDDIFKASKGDFAAVVASIAKSVTYIFALFGSQKLAKSLLNVT